MTVTAETLITDHLRDAAHEVPNKTFVEFLGGRSLTFASTEQESRLVAASLADSGATAGDRVALMVGNRPEALTVFFATHLIGAIFVPLNTALRGRSLLSALDLTAPRVLVIEDALLAELDNIVMERLDSLELVVHISEEEEGPVSHKRHETTYATFVQRGTMAVGTHVVSSDQASSIMLTSGTTGPSKGTVWTNTSTLFVARTFQRYSELSSDDVVYTCLPLFHSNALHLSMLGALLARCTVVIGARFSVQRFWHEVVSSNATVTSILGVMPALLLRQESSPLERSHCLRYALVIPASPETHQQMGGRFGLRPVEAYGLSDFGMVLWSPEGRSAPPGSCGRPVSGVEIQVVDDYGRLVPPGEAGELLVRTTHSGTAPLGYWQDSDATVSSRRDFWFHTGDLMRQDADGWFYFAGRTKETIRRRGENVSVYEIESQLLKHPAVVECAAYPLPAEWSEDEVAVAVVLAVGSLATEHELLSFIEPHLPYFSVPRYVTILRELPKTETMKVKRSNLIDRGVQIATYDAGDRRR